jgi:hypothetical protein
MSRLPVHLLLSSVLVLGADAVCQAQNLWIVDAAGAGDFSDLQPALFAASPGDLVWILPGEYGPALLDKRLTLLAEESLERPQVASLDVSAAENVQIQHLKIGAVRLKQTGRVLIDDCRIGPGQLWPSFFGAFLVTGASDLLISRSEVRGSYVATDGAPALMVEQNSTVQVVSSRLLGASVPASDLFKLSGYGGPALVLRSGGQAWVSDSDLIGGSGQDYVADGAFQPGAGGAGVSLQSGARLDLRGRLKNLLAGGLQNPGMSGPDDGPALFCSSGSNPAEANIGPVEIQGSLAACAALSGEPRAFLVPAPPNAGSPVGSVACYGPSGQAGLLATSFESGLSATPLVSETPLFLNGSALAELLPLVFNGFEEPSHYSWLAPSGWPFAGLAYHVQLFELPASGGMVGANSITFLLKP